MSKDSHDDAATAVHRNVVLSSPSLADRALSAALLIGICLATLSLLPSALSTMRAMVFPQEQRTPDSPAPIWTPEWVRFRELGTRIAGGGESRVSVLAFIDLECPACRAYHPELVELINTIDGPVDLHYVPLPLEGHRFAMPAARVADCLRDRDPAIVGQWIETVFHSQDSLGLLPWTELAIRAGVPDTSLVASCATNRQTPHRVDSAVALADFTGINATPTIMVDGWLFPGLPRLASVEAQITKRLAELNRQP